MALPTQLLRITLSGSPSTRNPSNGGPERPHLFRRGIERAIRTALVRREIPAQGPLGIRILLKLRPTRRVDLDNLAKPILDALRGVLGEDRWGRADDARVWELNIKRSDSIEEGVDLEIFKI